MNTYEAYRTALAVTRGVLDRREENLMPLLHDEDWLPMVLAMATLMEAAYSSEPDEMSFREWLDAQTAESLRLESDDDSS